MNSLLSTACTIRATHRAHEVLVGVIVLLAVNIAGAQERSAPTFASVQAASTASAASVQTGASSTTASAAAVAPKAPAPAVSLTPAELTARYPTGSIQSTVMANQALAEVQKARDRIDKEYLAQQNACYAKFFASSCLDAAKESHRQGVAQIRKVDVEASTFNRSARVVERDKNLAQKRANDASNPPKPMTESPAKTAPQGKAPGEIEDRVAKHDEKMRQEALNAKADAQKHADNVAAFDKKAKDAQARQQDVARKKADKAKQAAAKAASAASASASSAAASSASATVPPTSPPASKP
jgi:hypothetical protein